MRLTSLLTFAPALLVMAAEPSRSPQVITLTATNYVFLVPDTIDEGLVTFVLENKSDEAHEAILKRVPAGRDVRSAIASITNGNGSPDWVLPAGGPDVTDPGVTSTVMETLEPGTYFWMCVVAAPDGKSHAAKGMTRVMIVRRRDARVEPRVLPSREPATSVSIKLADFSFDVATPIESGLQWIRVDNVGRMPHELVIFRLARGKTLQDVKAWQRTKAGPAPFVRIGGVATIPAGAHAFVQLDATPGNYTLRCRIPDAASGRTHQQLGMETQITVRE